MPLTTDHPQLREGTRKYVPNKACPTPNRSASRDWRFNPLLAARIKGKQESSHAVHGTSAPVLNREDTSRPHGRTAFISKELDRYDIDITAISEKRLADEGSVCEPNGGYTFFWRDRKQHEERIHGVGFAIRNTFLRQLPELLNGINERLMKLRLPLSRSRHVTIISAYAPIFAPTFTSPDEDN